MMFENDRMKQKNFGISVVLSKQENILVKNKLQRIDNRAAST